MANPNRTGFYPVGTLTGAPWTAKVRRFIANTTTGNYCVGDLVMLDAIGKANIIGGTLYAGAITNILGAVVGIEPVAKTTTSVQGGSLSLEKQYLSKGTAGTQYVRVCTDPTTIYEAVVGGTGTTAVSNIGASVSILSLAGGTNTMAKVISSMVLDAASITTGTNIFQIVDFPVAPDNDLTAANARVHVVLNTSPYNRGGGAR